MSLNQTQSNLTNELFCTPGERYPDPPLWWQYREYFQYLESEEPAPYPTWEVALKCTTYAIAMTMGIVGNVSVLLILAMNKNMRTSTNVYIANLAISDLMVCLWCMWIHLGSNITTSWPFGEFFCRCYSFLQGWMAMASILILLVIACDRFFAIIYPLRARMTRMRCVLLIGLVWVASAAISAPNLMYNVMYDIQWANWREVWCEEEWPKYFFIAENSEGESYCSTYSPSRTAYLICTVVLLYLLPVVVMGAAYVIIGAKLWTRRVPGEQSYNTLHVQHKSRRKVVRMLIVVLLAFVICWTPFHGMRLYDAVRDKDQNTPDYILEMKYAFTYLAYFNSAINPILYAGLNDNFRKGFKNLMHCYACRGRNAIAPSGQQITANDGTLMFRHTKVTSLKLKLGFRQQGQSGCAPGTSNKNEVAPDKRNNKPQTICEMDAPNGNNNPVNPVDNVINDTTKADTDSVFCHVDDLDNSAKVKPTEGQGRSSQGHRRRGRKMTAEIAAVIQVEDVDSSSNSSVPSELNPSQNSHGDVKRKSMDVGSSKLCTLNVPMLEYRSGRTMSLGSSLSLGNKHTRHSYSG